MLTGNDEELVIVLLPWLEDLDLALLFPLSEDVDDDTDDADSGPGGLPTGGNGNVERRPVI